jgi:23S rRNA (adenine2503-C2)-methyltransferase
VTEKINIKSLGSAELIDWCSKHGLPTYRAGQILEWIWVKGSNEFNAMKNLPKEALSLLSADFFIDRLREEIVQYSKDGTEKYVFASNDQTLFEAVLIPSEDRTTVCISTQAGCALGCKFCATGQLGFTRNLEAWEIYDQVYYINQISIKKFGHKLSNIVFMGMGEPFLNFERVRDSIHKITDLKGGLGMSPQRITVSTVGIPEGIRRFALELPNVQLALSLHSANQEKREGLMPVAKKYSLSEITEALKYYHQTTSGRISIEYLLLGGVNDSDKDMQDLARFCKSFPVKINMIAYNSVTDASYAGSDIEKTRTFIHFLRDKNLVVNARKSRGADIDAACGQLSSKNKINNNL